MSRSKRLEPVQRLAEDRANAAAKAYGERRQFLDTQRQRLQQLEKFRDDYKHQRHQAGETGMDAYRLRDFNAFLGRIDAAVKQQREVIHSLEQEVEQLRLAWMETLGRSKAVDTAVDRLRTEEHRNAEKKEQSQQDELAQRLRNSSPLGGLKD